MKFSREFFIQRSFEVVWAIFRVSEYISRKKIREALEHKAIEFLVHKDKINLVSLEEVIRLSININEIKRANGNVLLREIDNLKSAINEMSDESGQSTLVKNLSESAPNIEEVFTKPPVLLSEFMKNFDTISGEDKNTRKQSDYIDANSITKNSNNTAVSDKSLAIDIDSSAMLYNSPAKSYESLTKNTEKDVKSTINTPKDINSLTKKTDNSIKNDNNGKTTTNTGNVSKKDANKKRREYIYNIVKARNLCHIKDIMAEFPTVSKRTIRYDIQQMVGNGIFERIGKGGPDSFFRLRRNGQRR